DYDILLLSGMDNIFYLSDIPVTDMAANPVLNVLQQFNPSILCITADGNRVLFAATSLAQYIDENISDITVYYYPTALFIDYRPSIASPEVYASSVSGCLVKFLTENGLLNGKIGMDAQFFVNPGADCLGAGNFVTENVERDLYFLRKIKSHEELRRMRHASIAAYAVMDWVKEQVEAGADITEAELFYGLRAKLLEYHCQWKFTTVACGKYSADVYHQPLADYRLKRGDTVRLDIGAVYQGYGSDVARTYFAPDVPGEYRKLYQTICDAQKLVLENLKPGAKGINLFHMGQEYVRSHGYPQYNRTMIGHSIGLQTEEYPFISPKDEMILEEGMVICIELPFYIKNLAGLNIEDIVLIKKNGIEYLRR
ncbi:MAG: Xaa-Pro peptidase family protein, partial [Dehalobacterium sp.]